MIVVVALALNMPKILPWAKLISNTIAAQMFLPINANMWS